MGPSAEYPSLTALICLVQRKTSEALCWKQRDAGTEIDWDIWGEEEKGEALGILPS